MIGRTWLSAIIGHTFNHLADDLALAAGTVYRARPQRRRDHAGPLAEQFADVQLTLDTALHADDDQAAVGRQRIDIAVEIGGAHDVENHVGASTP